MQPAYIFMIVVFAIVFFVVLISYYCGKIDGSQQTYEALLIKESKGKRKC